MTGVVGTQAITLDWNSVNWISGNLTQSFDIDPGNAGDDITITVSDPNGDISSNVNDNNNYTGGYGTSQESLYIQATGQSTTQYITVTITFLYAAGVRDVDFQIFDVDYANGQFRDVISSIDATRSAAAVGTASLTDSTYNDISTGDSGSSPFYQGPYAYGVTDNSTQHDTEGNLGVSFGSTVLDEISFRYYNQNETGQQAITLYDINYNNAIPEPSTYLSGALLAMLVGWQGFQRSRRRPVPNAA